MGEHQASGTGGTVVRLGGSFERFYDAHADRLRQALFLALGDRDLAIDASDEALTRAFEQWHQVETFGNPAGWVYRVGINWATSAQRRNRWRDGREVPDRPVHAPQVDVDLAEAMARLTTEQRVVVVCRYFLDWSIEQTAEALAVRPGTVKSRLSRAIEALHRTLEDES